MARASVELQLSDLNEAIERSNGKDVSEQSDIIERLLTKHPKLARMTNNRGECPLHIASYYGCEFAIRYLLGLGVDVNVTDSSGHTPLHLAAETRQVAPCELLIAAGADLTRRAGIGFTPLMAAIYTDPSNPVVGVLLSKGAPLDLRAAVNLGQKNLVRVLLKDNPALVHEKPDSDDLVSEASRRGDVSILAMLLEAGADPNTATVMHHSLEEALGHDDRSAVELLLRYGANPSKKVRPGASTPRQFAKENGIEWALELFDSKKGK